MKIHPVGTRQRLVQGPTLWEQDHLWSLRRKVAKTYIYILPILVQ